MGMESPANQPRPIDRGPSLVAIDAIQQLRKFAVSQRTEVDPNEPVSNPPIVTDAQLHTVVDLAGNIRARTIFNKLPGKMLKDGKRIMEFSSGPFKMTSFDDEKAKKKDPRLMTVECDDEKSPAVTITFYATARRGHEFNLFVDFGMHEEIDPDEPLTYDSGRRKREDMLAPEYEVISDVLTRAEKVIPTIPPLRTTSEDSQT